MQMRIADHVGGLMAAAGSKAPEGFTYSLKGDLASTGAQKYLLQQRGFIVHQSDVYPVLKEEDKKAALQIIWDNRALGWWNYDEMVKEGICSQEEWKIANKGDPTASALEDYKEKKKKENIEATPEINRKLRL